MTRSTRWRGLALILGLSAVETAASETGRVFTGTTTTAPLGATINLREAAARDRRAPRLQQVQPSPAAIRPPMPIPDMPPNEATAPSVLPGAGRPSSSRHTPPPGSGSRCRLQLPGVGRRQHVDPAGHARRRHRTEPPDGHAEHAGPSSSRATGANLGTVGLQTFWGPINEGRGETFDPRVIYDPAAGRWVTVASDDHNERTGDRRASRRLQTPKGT